MLLARSMLFVFSMRSSRGEEALGLATAAAAAGAGGGVGRGAFFLGREGGTGAEGAAGLAGWSSDELSFSSEESDMFAGKGGPSPRGGDCAPSREETGEGGVQAQKKNNQTKKGGRGIEKQSQIIKSSSNSIRVK